MQGILAPQASYFDNKDIAIEQLLTMPLPITIKLGDSSAGNGGTKVENADYLILSE